VQKEDTNGAHGLLRGHLFSRGESADLPWWIGGVVLLLMAAAVVVAVADLSANTVALALILVANALLLPFHLASLKHRGDKHPSSQ